MRAVHLALLCAVLPAALPAADHEFDTLVRNIEWRYCTRRMHIPLFGLANFFVKVARPGGTSDLKLAIFENIRYSGEIGLPEDALGQDWHPMVRVHSRARCEWTGVYARESGRRWELLLATFESNEAVVTKLRINPETMRDWIDQPERKARRH